MKLYIKYMVSLRCKMLVNEELNKLGIQYISVGFGEIEVKSNLTKLQYDQIKIALLKVGLELMDDKKSMLIERIKNVVIEMIHYSDELPKINFSIYISEKLNYHYTYLSNLFSKIEGRTVEHFILLHKIEKAKELIIYNELNLSEIATKLQYSSVAHLSNQFKKITGLKPSSFKMLKHKKRNTLENL